MLQRKGAGIASLQGQNFYLDNTGELCGIEFGASDGGQLRGPHPKMSGYLMTNYWLSGAHFTSRRILNDQIFMYAFTRNNGESIVFAWTLAGMKVGLSNTSLAARDVFGESVQVTSLGEEPVIFYSTTQSAAQLLNAVDGTVRTLGDGVVYCEKPTHIWNVIIMSF